MCNAVSLSVTDEKHQGMHFEKGSLAQRCLEELLHHCQVTPTLMRRL